jgi:hypothetical protein
LINGHYQSADSDTAMLSAMVKAISAAAPTTTQQKRRRRRSDPATSKLSTSSHKE